jgi:hypothetical protein
MPSKAKTFRIGDYRPIYLWAGPGTIRMNRLKFMNQDVDESAHYHAHSDQGVNAVLDEMVCNWVHLTYNWGFPPEIEKEDWEDFRKTTELYHQRREKVFAYIQTSNCVFDGSYKEKDWYARDPKGKKIFYYSGRFMACLTHPDWVQHLKDVIQGAIERGADGIFFDNMWHGAMPIPMFGTWLGAAGCHCEHCKSAYQQESGHPIPTVIDPDDPQVRHYLRYRADQTTRLIAELAAFVDQIQPGTPISANDYVHFTSATYVIYGQDIAGLSKVKDVTMIENFALPRWETQPRPRLANNALTIRNALAMIDPKAHLSILSYDIGIGFDGTYPPRRYQQGMAEAAACGASMTTKGTEYFVDGQHTVLTPKRFAPIQQAIGKFNRWLKDHADLYEGGQNIAPVGLLFPGEKLWLDWPQLAPLYQGAGQTLTVNGIPWRVVKVGDSLEGLAALLVFDPLQISEMDIPEDLRVILVPEIPGWSLKSPSWAARNPVVQAAASWMVHGLMDAYFASKPTRLIFDGLGLPKLITQSMVFILPEKAAQETLLATLPTIYPRVEADEPVLVDVWQREGNTQVHLVNYANRAQIVKAMFDRPVRGIIISPDGDGQGFDGSSVQIKLDIYKVLILAEC